MFLFSEISTSMFRWKKFGLALTLRNKYLTMPAGENFSGKGEKYVANAEAYLLDLLNTIKIVNISCTSPLPKCNLGKGLDSGGFDGCCQEEMDRI